ncbi:MAG TPA: hypothetical protein VMT93_07140 [Gemmatimonadaceae bacterium]|nr:hypothetical protein [Gemmatimonadaceae bacterium]
MRHYHRTQCAPDAALALADEFFKSIGLARTSSQPRARAFSGPLGTLTLRIRSEGGHAYFLEVETDQVGESRLDRNVKRYFVRLHRAEEPSHALEAAY